MGKYIKLFNTHSEYEVFTATTEFLLPNVSHCIQENEVHYNPIVPPIQPLMVTYNVEGASSPTQLYFYYTEGGQEEWWVRGVDMFDKVEIDGVEVSVADLDSVSGTYQLSSGEHTVAYTLKDPTFIGSELDEETGMPTRIGAMFMGCMTITNAQIPNTVTSIGDSALQGCNSITSVTIHDSVTSIGNNAFQGCSSLTRVEIDSNTIMSATYTYQNNLKNIFGTQVTEYVIDNSVTSIGDYVFYQCTGLTSINIPSGVTSIGQDAFYGCSSLTGVIIPNSVTTIGDWAFGWCSSLTSVTLGSGVTNIGEYGFACCPLDAASKAAIEAINPIATDCMH